MTHILWTKANCPQCKLTSRQLDAAGIDYEVRSFDDEPELVEEARAMGFQSAPVVITDDDAWCGFRPDKLAGLTA